MRRECHSRNENLSVAYCTLQNALCVTETPESKEDKNDFLDWDYFDMERARNDKATEGKSMTTLQFQNPLFEEMFEK